MDFEEHTSNTPTYHGDHFQFGEQIFRQPIWFDGNAPQNLSPQSWQNLTLDDFQAAKQAGATLILIGTGEKQHFIAPALHAQLSAQGLGVESMNTAAACRTLLLLQGENRRVWAYLFL